MITYTQHPSYPKLGWFAEVSKHNFHVKVKHGCYVEINEDFLVEGVWDGEFGRGNFNSSNHFFGSGLKIKTNEIIAVPSTALVDRIFVGESKNHFFISNSLIIFLAETDSRLDPHNNYKKQSDAIFSGVNKYNPEFPVLNKINLKCHQFFYHPIKISAHGINKLPRTENKLIESFDNYISVLNSDLRAIRENSLSDARERPLSAYTTVSRGYDSAAVTALTKDLGINGAFTSQRSNSGFFYWLNKDATNDDGTEIAKKLGLSVFYLDYQNDEILEDELAFLSTSPAEPEIIFYKMVNILDQRNSPSIVFTGYHGDKLWAKNLSGKYLNHEIIRGDTSGLNLSEARLQSGFLNVPIPFMYARQIVNIHKISNSNQMNKWSIGTDYDRPIPRRILEELGISRRAFGIRKKAVISYYNQPKNKCLRKKFRFYLKQEFNLSHARTLTSVYLDFVNYYYLSVIFRLRKQLNIGIPPKPPLNINRLNLPYKLFFWALEMKRNDFIEKGRSRDPELQNEISTE